MFFRFIIIWTVISLVIIMMWWNRIKEKIGLDKFCDYLSKINMDFTDFILEDWESVEEGNVKLNGLTEKQWMNLYVQFLEKKIKWI